jgi:hypothetical protein
MIKECSLGHKSFEPKCRFCENEIKIEDFRAELARLNSQNAYLRGYIHTLECSFGESPDTVHCPIDSPCLTCKVSKEKDSWHAPNFAYWCCSNGKGKNGSDICTNDCPYGHLSGCEAVSAFVDDCKSDPDLIQHD